MHQNSLKSEWFLQRPQHALTSQLPSKREKSLKWTQKNRLVGKKTVQHPFNGHAVMPCRVPAGITWLVEGGDARQRRLVRCFPSMSRHVESLSFKMYRHVKSKSASFCFFLFVLYEFGYLDVLTARRVLWCSLCISFRSISCLTFFQVLHRWRVPLQSHVLGESFERQTHFRTVFPRKLGNVYSSIQPPILFVSWL